MRFSIKSKTALVIASTMSGLILLILFRLNLDDSNYVNVFMTASFFSLIDIFFEPMRLHVLWFVKEKNQLPRSILILLFLKLALIVLGLIIWKINLLVTLFIFAAYLWTIVSLFLFITRMESLIPFMSFIVNIVQVLILWQFKDIEMAIRASLISNLFFFVYTLTNLKQIDFKLARSSGFLNYCKPLYYQSMLSVCKMAIPRLVSFKIGVEFSAFFEFYDRLLKRVSKFFDKVYIVFLRDLDVLAINGKKTSFLSLLLSLVICSVLYFVYAEEIGRYWLYIVIVCFEVFFVGHGIVRTKMLLSSGHTRSIAKASFVRFLFTLGLILLNSPLGILLVRLGGSVGYLKAITYAKSVR